MREAKRPTSRIGSLTSRIAADEAAQAELLSSNLATRRPWWHSTRTPASSLIVGALALLAAACAWWVYAEDPRWWQAVAATVWTVQAISFGSSGLIRPHQGEPLRSSHSHQPPRHL